MLPPLGRTGEVVFSDLHPTPAYAAMDRRARDTFRARHDSAASRGHSAPGCHTHRDRRFVELAVYHDPDAPDDHPPVYGIRTVHGARKRQLIRYTDWNEARTAYQAAADHFHTTDTPTGHQGH